jgi:hypothetical protein
MTLKLFSDIGDLRFSKLRLFGCWMGDAKVYPFGFSELYGEMPLVLKITDRL